VILGEYSTIEAAYSNYYNSKLSYIEEVLYDSVEAGDLTCDQSVTIFKNSKILLNQSYERWLARLEAAK